MYVVLGVCALLMCQAVYGYFQVKQALRTTTADSDLAAVTSESIAKEHWKSYAIALEVLCECCAEGDLTGADHALVIIQSERDTLRLLGEYDD